ncbi:hypothetical protein ACJIZ3_012416 [Penstemon smallii]|uniref:Uncharacterized protein n=1 Tax=Penstemon smallii TaxID=265156 RepID=A0ABD3ULY8_9LAMI
MDIDPDISNWVLEFILKVPLGDRTLNSLLRALPLPNNNHNLKKSLLLKKLESEVSSNSISESSLEVLEQLEEIEFRLGHEMVSEAIKRAYCAVAVECTVKQLAHEGDLENSSKYNFFEAVKILWRGRIRRMEKELGNGGLGSEELRGWKDEIEAAVWDDSVCESIVKKSEAVNAVEAVSTYLREEKEKTGPSFLEMVAARVKDDKVMQGMLGVGNVDPVSEKEAILSRPDTERNEDREVRKQKIHLRNKFVGLKRFKGQSSGNPRGAKIAKISDSDEMSVRPSFRNYNLSRSAEVNEVREALKSSSVELKAVVKDPFPDALRLAEEISDMARKSKAHNLVEENHDVNNMFIVDSDGVVQDAQCNVSNPDDAGVQANQCDASNVGSAGVAQAGVTNVRGSSLVAWNNSAHTYEWDESPDGSPEDSSNRRSRPQLPSPKRVHVSPLKKYENQSLKGRRRRRKWSVLEEDTLRAGVEKYGKGNWKVILTAYHDIFEERTDVDLKDKWRNLTR